LKKSATVDAVVAMIVDDMMIHEGAVAVDGCWKRGRKGPLPLNTAAFPRTFPQPKEKTFMLFSGIKPASPA
jgi:hypothetical protein